MFSVLDADWQVSEGDGFDPLRLSIQRQGRKSSLLFAPANPVRGH